MAPSSYSSDVALWLVVGEARLGLSDVGSASLTVEGTADHMPSGPARLVVSVDGHETVRDVFLPDGIPAGERPQVAYHANENGRANHNGRG
jgi:hypothetical protein